MFSSSGCFIGLKITLSAIFRSTELDRLSGCTEAQLLLTFFALHIHVTSPSPYCALIFKPSFRFMHIFQFPLMWHPSRIFLGIVLFSFSKHLVPSQSISCPNYKHHYNNNSEVIKYPETHTQTIFRTS